MSEKKTNAVRKLLAGLPASQRSMLLIVGQHLHDVATCIDGLAILDRTRPDHPPSDCEPFIIARHRLTKLGSLVMQNEIGWREFAWTLGQIADQIESEAAPCL